jgi:1-acyl-sn-glycerol-3-phosphate acyltransferase
VSERSNPYFTGDRYETPADLPRDVLDRLCLGGSAWFYTLLLQVVLRSRADAIAGKYDDPTWAESSYAVLRALERCGARFHIEGIDHVRRLEEPVVFVSNHMSTVETMVFPCIIVPFRPVTYVVKQSLTTMPLFGPIMRSRDPVTVGRENPREDMQAVLTEGQRRLEAGISVILFPQSTRQVEFAPEHFNSLGVKLARRAGVKVLPVAIKTDFWGNGRLIKDLGPLHRAEPIHIRFGEPLAVEGGGKAEHQAIVRFIQENLDRWQAAR